MKRLLAVPLVVLGMLVWGSVAYADHEDDSKPLCAGIVNESTGYGLETSVVTSDITTHVASCKGVTYSVVIQVDPDDSVDELLTFSSRGTGTSLPSGRGQVIVITDPIVDDDNMICIYVMSSRGGSQGTNNLLDRFPNAPTCTNLALGGQSGSGGHA